MKGKGVFDLGLDARAELERCMNPAHVFKREQ